MFSKKATKIDGIFTVDLTLCSHTIPKSSKMDGAKYIPNFAFNWW
jgi:hypothetical protein